MRTVVPFNEAWVFSQGFAPNRVATLQGGETVDLPHSALELPLCYFDDADYQKPYLYQKVLPWQAAFDGRIVTLVFDGAMADAVVYVNGHAVTGHRDGYTPFEARISDFLQEGDNLISVHVDGTENPEFPPFGGQIDFLTYAGIYRDVWLRITDPLSIHNLRIETGDVLGDLAQVSVAVSLDVPDGVEPEGTLTLELLDATDHIIRREQVPVSRGGAVGNFDSLDGVRLWHPDDPVLYEMRVTLDSEQGRDQVVRAFGFRTVEFTADGFLLNGAPFKLRGLNRHQSFPYVGYAMGRRVQERDAEILRHELNCNVVRTSHYPQSTYFLDHCDRIGLLVIEEIPGWQHIGGPAWQREAVGNVRRMIERDWNHPSIIMWGVRINESGDDHSFYSETNRLARRLDPSRPTGGIRCIENSEMLEDVYTMNDFFLGATKAMRGNLPPAPLRTQQQVTGLGKNVPYLVTEYNGHMYPTKATDSEERQAEHVLRHLRVLDALYGDAHISGAIGWCMADYNTHRDFGSGDRVCHHGVLDMFREPKFAAYVYASQSSPEDRPILKPVTYWARGERSIGGVLPLIVLTNCEFVEFSYGAEAPRRVEPDRQNFPNLPFAPVVIDSRSVAPEDTGAWGMAWEDGLFTGYVHDRPVAQVRLAANPQPSRLEMTADSDRLEASGPHRDATRVMLRALDQYGNILPYLDDVIYLEADGPGRVIGPDVLTLKAGHVGFWVETTGGTGRISVAAYAQRMGTAKVTIAAI